MKHRLIVAVFIVFFGLSFSLVPVGDPDLGWHLVGGEYVDTQDSVPRKDFINCFTSEWVDYHWLAQWLLYKSYKLGGFDLLRVLLGLLMVGTLFVFLGISRANRSGRINSASIELLVVTVVVLLLSSVISVRPQSLALLLLSLAYYVLLRGLRFELLILIATSILLANLHVYWVVVPFVWLVLRVFPRFLKLDGAASAAYAWGGLLVLSLTGLVSPYTYQNYLVLWDYLNLQPSVRSTVNEFRSGLLIEGPQSWIILGMIIVVVRGVRWEQLRHILPQLVLFTSGLTLVLNGSKFLGIYVILSLPLIYVALIQSLGPLLRKHSEKLWFGVVVIALCSSWWMVKRLPKWSDGGLTFIAEHYPIEACQQIAQLSSSSEDRLRVLTHFNDGGWCGWASRQVTPARDICVTHDGRTQFVSDQHYSDLFSAFSLKSGWKEKLDSFHPDYLVIPSRAALANIPGSISGWSLVKRQGGFEVLSKVPSYGEPPGPPLN